MKKKMSLKSLEISSFVTGGEKFNPQTIKGGSSIPPSQGCPPPTDPGGDCRPDKPGPVIIKEL